MQPVLTTTAVLGLALLAAPAPAADPLNEKVLQFARAHLGKQVGNGECWTLADEALRSAEAHRPGTDGYSTFVFGREIGVRDLQSGDVIQFHKVRFEHRDASGVGSWEEFPQHTAIVARVKGGRITLLHQNFRGNHTVQMSTIDLADRKRGTLRYYRPQPR
jgi:hypothetical protein